MFKRTFTLAVLLGAAVGVPYVSSQWSTLKANFTGGSSAALSRSASYGQTTTPLVQPLYPSDAQREETPIVDMAEAFRFDVTPAWVMSRWPRVTAGLYVEKYQGMRVPLITGMREDDLAGSLTYYFTASQHCGKIVFSGSTGNPQRATTTLVQKFGFKPFASDKPGVQRWQIRWNGTALSELTVQPAAVVRNSAPFARYEVQLMVTDSTAQ
jgi:hypothetical protein